MSDASLDKTQLYHADGNMLQTFPFLLLIFPRSIVTVMLKLVLIRLKMDVMCTVWRKWFIILVVLI